MASLDSDSDGSNDGTTQPSSYSWIAPSVDEDWDATGEIQAGTLVVLSPSASPLNRWLAMVAVPPKPDSDSFTVYFVTKTLPPSRKKCIPILHPKYLEHAKFLNFDLCVRTTPGVKVLACGGIQKGVPRYVLKRRVFNKWEEGNADGGEMLDRAEVPAKVCTAFDNQWESMDEGALW